MACDDKLIIINGWWAIVAGTQVWSGEIAGDAGGGHRAAAKYAPNPPKPTNSKAANCCLLRNGHPTQSSCFSLYRSGVCMYTLTESQTTVAACGVPEVSSCLPSAQFLQGARDSSPWLHKCGPVQLQCWWCWWSLFIRHRQGTLLTELGDRPMLPTTVELMLPALKVRIAGNTIYRQIQFISVAFLVDWGAGLMSRSVVVQEAYSY